MEKHRCKLCHRNFANGRALGGHMRSHVMMNLYAPSKPKQGFLHEDDEEEEDMFVSEEEIESVPSSSSEDEEQENGEKGLFSYQGMSSNHRKSGGGGGGFGMADSDHYCFGAAGGGSVVLQDRESETESSKNPIRRRSRRVRKSRISDAIQFSDCFIQESPKGKKPNSEKQGRANPSTAAVEAEPVSSISDTTPEENVAHCLMMLSRDKWEEEEQKQKPEKEEDFFHEETEEPKRKGIKSKQHYCHDFDVVKVTKSSSTRSRGKYRCETCNKVFRSYQALGGHRASHKRIKLLQNNNNKNNSNSSNSTAMMMVERENNNLAEEKIHECPVCYRVFASGQALGGHKRSHVMGSAAIHHQIVKSVTLPAPKASSSRIGESFIDLNLPAPVDDDDDDVSQVELSAVSDPELVNPFKHSS